VTTIGTDLKTTGVAEVIVVLDPAAAVAASSARTVLGRLAPHFSGSELSQRSAIIEDGFIAAASPSRAPSAPVPATARQRGAPASETAAPSLRFFEHLGIAYGVVDRAGLAALRADPDVRSVTGAPQLRLIRPTKKQKASLTRSVTWGIAALGVPALWEEGLTGEGVVVAHLDTGVDGKHPALQGALSAFVEMDRLGFPVQGSSTAFDTDDHGTHTAATIAGRPDKLTKRHVGVAPGAKLVSAIVIEGGQTIARVLAGMDWALGNGARILSMSLGFPGYVEDFLPVSRNLRRRGMLPVIATGNEGPGTSRSPGNYPEALSVGWANRDDTVDPDSSSQRFRRRTQPVVPDLVAPGGDIVSAAPGGGHQLMSGTSMATPHVAGLAALLWQAEPEATVTRIERAIFASCAPLPGVPDTRQGRGLPHAPRALAHLLGH
jgi:subtilisin